MKTTKNKQNLVKLDAEALKSVKAKSKLVK